MVVKGRPGDRAKALTLLLALALMLALLVAPPAVAGKSDYPEPLRMFWSPDYGTIRVASGGQILPHFVDSLFAWNEWPQLTRVDCPRTPCATLNWGTYEHELRFVANQYGGYYCDTNYPTENRVTSLPLDSYRDQLGSDRGEFSWGVQAWRLQQGEVYSIHFECQYTTQARDGGTYNLQGQLGHCHTFNPCSDTNTYADETTRLVPSALGTAPNNVDWLPPWANNFSFELAPTDLFNDWTVSIATPTRVGVSGSPYHGNYFWKITPTTTTSQSHVYFEVFPEPSVGRNAVYNEFRLRCPTTGNADNCRFILRVAGYNAAGATTRVWNSGAYTAIPRDNQWYSLFLQTLSPTDPSGLNGFPSGTVRWRFILDGYPADLYNVDYTHQFYYPLSGAG